MPLLRRTLLVLSVCFGLLSGTVAGAQAYTSVVVFGDSLSDTGNDLHVTASSTLPVPSPITGYTSGRFTDGTDTSPAAHNYFGNWVDQLAKLLPANPAVTDSLDGGTNYAYGYARTGTGQSVLNYPGGLFPVNNLGAQISTYLATKPKITNNTLFIVWGGANDVLDISPTSSSSAIAAAITTAVTNDAGLVQQLITAGATNIIVPNLPDLGLTPGVNGSPTTAIPATQVSQAFDQGLATALAGLATANPTVHIYQLDAYTLLNTIVASPSTYAFANVTAQSQLVTAVNPDTYLFWDYLHPTTYAHSLIAASAFRLLGTPVATTAVVASSNLNAVTNTPVTFTATVSATTGTSIPMGTVTFYDGSTALGTGFLSGSPATATYTTSALTAASHQITAVYAADNGFAGSPAAAITENVTPPVSTATAVVSSNLNANVNTSVTFTASVTATTGTPTGTVTFYDGMTVLGTGTLSGSPATATYTTSGLAAGTHLITAVYAGVTGFITSASTPAISEVISTVSTSTTVVSSNLNVNLNASVTFTASVTAAAGTPTGTVTFYDGSTILGTGTLSGSTTTATATYMTSSLGPGTHPITAVYGGVTGSFGGSSTAAAISEVVTTTTGTAVVSSNLNANLNASVTFTASVTVPTGTPTGTVTFYDGMTILGSGTLSGSPAVATYTTSGLAAGTHLISAAYAGVTGFTGSMSLAISEVVTAPPATTGTVVTSSKLNADLNASVTFTASVTASAGTPTGTVSFYDGTTLLGTGSLSGSPATATYTTVPLLTAGTHSITAVYAGVTGFIGSTSLAISEIVTAPNFTMAFSPSPLTVTSGSSGTSSLTITTVGGFSGTAVVACGTPLPAHFSCSFSSTSLSIGSDASASTTVTIGTGVASAMLSAPKVFRGPEIFAAFSAFGFLGLAAFRQRRTAVRRIVLMAMFALLSGGALLGLSGCGGGGTATNGSTPANPNFAVPGTYNVPVTVTMNGGTPASTSLTVVVQ